MRQSKTKYIKPRDNQIDINNTKEPPKVKNKNILQEETKNSVKSRSSSKTDYDQISGIG